ncbi:hypothetical protein DBV15_09808 [Temnothorax longispinosus]|uniref:Uncharacterized protein n=1 Tax=Temnothorax longispinosus TaxID=300112 RepID=A0A4S2K271_9HYME|nr:hypothetical protein DBV15_09808 [Temnothorax longispinosus]
MQYLEEPLGILEAVPGALLLLHQHHRRRRRRRRLFLLLFLLLALGLRQRQLQHLLEPQANRPTGATVLGVPMIGVARRVRLLMIPTFPPPRILARARLPIALRILMIIVLLGHRPPGLHEGVVDANRSCQRGSLLGRCQVRGLMPRQGFAQAVSRASKSPEFVGRRRRLLVEIQFRARSGQTIIAADPMTDGHGPHVVLAVIVVAVVIVVVPAGVVVVHVTTLLGALQTIVIFLGDVTTRRETIAHIGATATLVASDRATAAHDLVTIRLLSHLLQEGLISQLQVARDLKSPLTGFDPHNICTWEITGTATETLAFPPVLLRFVDHRDLVTGPVITRHAYVRGLMPRQGFAQAVSRASKSPEFVGRRRRLLVEIQFRARSGQTIIAADPMTDGHGPHVVLAVIVVAVVIVVVPAGVVVVHVTTLLGALQTIVIFLGDVTTRRETIAHIGATATLVASDRATAAHDLVTIRLLSHLLQVLEGTEDLLVDNVSLLARVISGTHIRGASHHRHPVHLFAHLDHDLHGSLSTKNPQK